MKAFLRQLVRDSANAATRPLLVREYLQARMLESLQQAGAFQRWAFVGGTALRFLYGMPRFSEDLDFSLIEPGIPLDFRETLQEVRRALARETYQCDVTAKHEKTVASAFVKFPGLLFELGLSPRPAQKLSIKLEVDTKPPAGAGLETTLVRRHVTLHLCHHDKGSLLAGKLHAILSRRWAKGRDLYDLAWYLADRTWPTPNLVLLNNALTQTGWFGERITPKNWRQQIWTRLRSIDWHAVQDDVRPFLERESDVQLVSRATIERLLRSP